MKTLLIILGFPLWFPLLIAAFAVALFLYISLWVVIISVISAFVSLLACGVFAGLGVGIYFAVTGNIFTGLALVGCGLACIGLSIFTFFAAKGLIIFAKNVFISLKDWIIISK